MSWIKSLQYYEKDYFTIQLFLLEFSELRLQLAQTCLSICRWKGKSFFKQ